MTKGGIQFSVTKGEQYWTVDMMNIVKNLLNCKTE